MKLASSDISDNPMLQTWSEMLLSRNNLPSVFNLIGPVSPALLHDKMICREICNLKISWGTAFLDQLMCKKSLLMSAKVSGWFEISILKVDPQAFDDALKDVFCVAVYFMIH